MNRAVNRALECAVNELIALKCHCILYYLCVYNASPSSKHAILTHPDLIHVDEVCGVAFCFRTVKVGMAARMNSKRRVWMGILAVRIFLPAVLFKLNSLPVGYSD